MPHLTVIPGQSCLDSVIDTLPTSASASMKTQARLCLQLSENITTPHRQTHQTDDRNTHNNRDRTTFIHTQHTELQTYRRTRLDHTMQKLWEEEEEQHNNPDPMPIWIQKLNQIKAIKNLNRWDNPFDKQHPLSRALCYHRANFTRSEGLGLQRFLSHRWFQFMQSSKKSDKSAIHAIKLKIVLHFHDTSFFAFVHASLLTDLLGQIQIKTYKIDT